MGSSADTRRELTRRDVVPTERKCKELGDAISALSSLTILANIKNDRNTRLLVRQPPQDLLPHECALVRGATHEAAVLLQATRQVRHHILNGTEGHVFARLW